MKLLGHAYPEMTMLYLDIALTDLQREFHAARSQPRHLTPQPKTQVASAPCRLGRRPRFRTGRSTPDGNVPPLSPMAIRAVVLIGSPIVSPRSSLYHANSALKNNRQRLAGYVGLP